MNIFQVQQKFNTQAKCIKHLEKERWGNKPICPHCQSSNVTPRKSRRFFYHCNKCNKDFTVQFGTIFEASKLKLPKWFMLIAMMLNARKGISAKEISRQIGLTYKTAWYTAMRVRCAMIDQVPLLEGILEMDEAYFGGKPRKRNFKANIGALYVKPKRGRGTKNIPVVGIVEREGSKRVVTEIIGNDEVNSKTMLNMLRKYVNTEKAIMMTDEAKFYNKFDNIIQHLVIKHKEKYAEGIIHTNTIEGFWSIIKNGIRGEYHVLSRKYLPFYLAEFTYKYNRRFKQDEAFDETIKHATEDEKVMVNYKPKISPDKIAYGKKVGEVTPPKPKPKRKYRKRKPKRKLRQKTKFRKIPKRNKKMKVKRKKAA